jgi:hypothetical protein
VKKLSNDRQSYSDTIKKLNEALQRTENDAKTLTTNNQKLQKETYETSLILLGICRESNEDWNESDHNDMESMVQKISSIARGAKLDMEKHGQPSTRTSEGDV